MERNHVPPEERTTIPEYIIYSLAICGMALYNTARKMISTPQKCLGRMIIKTSSGIGGLEEQDLD